MSGKKFEAELMKFVALQILAPSGHEGLEKVCDGVTFGTERGP